MGDALWPPRCIQIAATPNASAASTPAKPAHYEQIAPRLHDLATEVVSASQSRAVTKRSASTP